MLAQAEQADATDWRWKASPVAAAGIDPAFGVNPAPGTPAIPCGSLEKVLSHPQLSVGMKRSQIIPLNEQEEPLPAF